jgi:hypothetical protein
LLKGLRRLGSSRRLCIPYSITTSQAAIIVLFRVTNRYVRNVPPMLGIFPDTPAPGCATQKGWSRSAFRFLALARLAEAFAHAAAISCSM